MILVLFAEDRCPHCPSCETLILLHLWYLPESLVVFSFFNRCLDVEVKKNKWQMLSKELRDI